MTKSEQFIPFLLALCLTMTLTGCGVRPIPPEAKEEASRALAGGSQSAPTPTLRALVQDLTPLPPEERLTAMLRRVSERFVFDPWQNNAQLTLDAETLAKGGALGGCGAYALVEVALIRALGLPARLVLTAEEGWIKRFQEDGLSLISGHTFIEVLVEGRWLLVDPTFFVLYDNYQADRPCYPNRQLFVARGLDFHDMKLRTITDLQTLYANAAASAPLPWREPELSPLFSLELHPPTVLTQAGQFFIKEHRYTEAEERLNKALAHTPEFTPALLARGQLFFLRQEYAPALADLDRAIQTAPDDPTGYRWRAQASAALGQQESMCADLALACDLGHCAEWEQARGRDLCSTGAHVGLRHEETTRQNL